MGRLSKYISLCCLALMVVDCTSSPVGRLRFVNRPVVWRVNDRKPIPKPAELIFANFRYFNDAYLLRRLPRALEFKGHRRALGVNSIDEVPDSTWFENRIGVRDVSVTEVRRGPGTDESPEHHRPWTITGTKVGGASVGFLIKDSRGSKHLLKFDEKKNPVMETAAAIIVQRLLHVIGYNVPEDNIVHFRRSDLVVAEDAVVKDPLGNKRPMTNKDLEDNLAKIDIGKDGRIRGFTSRYLPGVPIGGISPEGTRKDDPNDRVPHQLRRDLRGLNAIYAWFNHTDIKEANTLDMWSPDPNDPRKSYVIHYQIDFGKALGSMGYMQFDKRVGYTHNFDIKYLLLSLPTFGLWARPWEDLRQPVVPEVGLYTAQNYDPGSFLPSFPHHPFDESDRFDNFWAAKIIMRLKPEHIRAAVEQGRYSTRQGTEYMIRALVERQRITARHWFDRVNPLDRFDVSESKLCFDDLPLKHKLEPRGGTRYEADAFDYTGQSVAWQTTAHPGVDGRTCVKGFTLPAEKDGYLIVRIATRRSGRSFAPVHVHLARRPGTRIPRVIGLRRY